MKKNIYNTENNATCKLLIGSKHFPRGVSVDVVGALNFNRTPMKVLSSFDLIVVRSDLSIVIMRKYGF